MVKIFLAVTGKEALEKKKVMDIFMFHFFTHNVLKIRKQSVCFSFWIL